MWLKTISQGSWHRLPNWVEQSTLHCQVIRCVRDRKWRGRRSRRMPRSNLGDEFLSARKVLYSLSKVHSGYHPILMPTAHPLYHFCFPTGFSRRPLVTGRPPPYPKRKVLSW